LGDVLVHATEVELLERVLPPAAQLFEHVPDALQALAVAVSQPALHHPAQRGVEVAVVQQVVRDLVQDAIGVELEAHLGAVPAGVGEAARHARPVLPARRLHAVGTPWSALPHTWAVAWAPCGCRAPLRSWTCRASRTTRRPSATRRRRTSSPTSGRPRARWP